jgi:hypothetical protein
MFHFIPRQWQRATFGHAGMRAGEHPHGSGAGPTGRAGERASRRLAGRRAGKIGERAGGLSR